MVEHLLQTGANVHARDDGGLIPLHNACSFGHAEVVSLLLCQGADPNARDNWNYTPLHEAAIKGKIDVCIGKSCCYFLFIHVKSVFLSDYGLGCQQSQLKCRFTLYFLSQCCSNMEPTQTSGTLMGSLPWIWRILRPRPF